MGGAPPGLPLRGEGWGDCLDSDAGPVPLQVHGHPARSRVEVADELSRAADVEAEVELFLIRLEAMLANAQGRRDLGPRSASPQLQGQPPQLRRERGVLEGTQPAEPAVKLQAKLDTHMRG